ncbi:MAG: amidohydrolase, partial [Alphaproteobacteria bacterium]|nr:amidohydrolase [Alphaproteobacteria bacterium]
LHRDAHMVVDGARIVEVRPGRFSGDLPLVAVPFDILLPGFISGHTHVASGTPTRGIIEAGGPRRRASHLVAALGERELDDLTAYNLAEILRSGCTTQLEMSQSLRQAESYVRVAKRWGVRGYPGGMVPATPRVDAIWARTDDRILFESVPETLREIEANLAFARRHMNAGEGRIRPMLAPHATDTHTPETLRALAAGARELGTGLHFHVAQSAEETARVRALWGKTPVQWLDSLGLLEMPMFGAHMTALDWRTDPDILNRRGSVYVHCPSAGGAGGMSQPYPEALGAGMNVNVGLDTHSNDYVENLKLAVIAGRARAELVAGHHSGPVVAPAMADALAGATIVAARGLGRDDLGRLAVGARADFISIDLAGFLVGAGAVPPEPLHNLMYANGLSVRHVATDGRFQVFDGHLVIDDEAEVIRRGAAVVETIWTQLSREGRFGPQEWSIAGS